MEALNFLRFWRTTTIATMPFTITEPIMVVDYLSGDDDEEEEEDSFFDIKITSDFDNKENTGHLILEANSEKSVQNLKNQKQPLILQPILSPSEFVSKRKVLPIEPNSSKPQSPIALLKSAQTFRVFKFKKPNVPKFTRETSVRNRSSQKSDLSTSDDTSSSKRFDLRHKYLNMFKPLFDKVSHKKQNEKVKFAMHVPMASPSKMKQGNVPVGSSSPAVMRRDDSLLQQFDGIQDAILHCKRSFNSSTDSSMDLSRKSAEEMRDVSI